MIKTINLTMFQNVLLFIACVVGTLLIGMLSGFLSGASGGYDGLNMPALSPPPVVFSIVWPVLYTFMGIALFLILTSTPHEDKLVQTAVTIWAIQLAFNFLWSFLFFTFDLYIFSFIWIVLLLAMVVYLIIITMPINKLASILLIPYALWLTFACYLNLSIALLN